jgi:hypothetical protein
MKTQWTAIRAICLTYWALSVGSPAAALAPQALRGWKVYGGLQSGFRAQYPADWHILPPPDVGLDIVSFPLSKREIGSIIPFGGARIVLLERTGSALDMERLIRFNASGNEPVSRAVVVLRRIVPRQDLRTTEIVSVWRDGKIDYENVDSYFEISRRLFSGRLTYWKDDTASPQYQQVFHQILETVALAGESQR